MAIQVIGLNPAVDVEWRVDRVNWNEKTVVQSARSWAGGKPPNVARWISYLGGNIRLVMPLGGSSGALVAEEMRASGVDLAEVPIAEDTRTNVMVTQKVGQQLRFNPQGPRLARKEWIRVFAEAEAGFAECDLTILSGSLPRAAPKSTYARLIRVGNRAGGRMVLDCDGPAFAAGVKARPFLVKPNRFELSLWAERPLKNEKQIRIAAEELSMASGAWVFVSLDSGGAILVNAAEGFRAKATAPRVRALNEVGAGDALLAQVGMRIEQGADPEEWLKWGVATGTSFVQVAAGKRPGFGLIGKTAKQVAVRAF
jgi:1-phosphofructokinase family hexose kinase